MNKEKRKLLILFANHALQGLLSSPIDGFEELKIAPYDVFKTTIVETAYDYAEQMIKELDKRTGESYE